MAGKGPSKTPTSVLKARGSWRANQRKGEPKPKGDKDITPPKVLDKYAREEWRYHYPIVREMKVMTEADKQLLAQYCQTLSIIRKAQEELQKQQKVADEGGPSALILVGLSGVRVNPLLRVINDNRLTALRFMKELGLTPAARASLTVAPEKPQTEKDKKLTLLKKRA